MSASLEAAFPTAGVLDNFNDTELPMTGWAQLLGDPFVSRFASNGTVASPDDSNSNDYWTAAQFGPDFEIYGTITGLVTQDTGKFAFMITSPVGAFDSDGWSLEYVRRSDTDDLVVSPFTDFVPTNAYVYDQEISVGDSIGLERIGSSLQPYYKAAAGSWVTVGSPVNDASNPGTGYFAMTAPIASDGSVDNVGAGTVVGGSTATTQRISTTGIGR